MLPTHTEDFFVFAVIWYAGLRSSGHGGQPRARRRCRAGGTLVSIFTMKGSGAELAGAPSPLTLRHDASTTEPEGLSFSSLSRRAQRHDASTTELG